MAKLSKTLVAGAVVLIGILAGSSAGAGPAAQPVGPNQPFVGLVNSRLQSATIDVVCPGPIRVNQHGNPAPGQTVGIGNPTAVAATFGFTGSRADSIVAFVLSPAASGAVQAVTFTTYGNQPIPTAWDLPCTGRSTMLFVPRPTSKTARSARVTVTFVPVCLTPVCPASTTAARRS
jgi:hypothetical protein